MSNLSNTPKLITCRIDAGCINEKSLIPIFETDMDFSMNEELYRPDTLELGFETEAERVSKEIYDKCIDRFDCQEELIDNMLKEVFEVEGFIGTSNEYGGFTYEIIQTEYEFIIIIATII